VATDLYQQVVSAHRRVLDRLIDRGAVERLRNVYQKATSEVLSKLERLGRGSTSFTYHHLQMALAQLKAGQIYVNDAMLGELNAATREAQVESLHGLVRDYKKLEKHFSGHAPILPIEEAARFAGVIDKSRGSLLRQHSTSVRRFGMNVIDGVQEQMAVSLASGETLDGAITRVHSTIKGEFYAAERIARTETAWSVNSTHNDGIKEIAKEDPALLSQWTEFCGPDGAPLDDRVGVDSIALAGQVAAPGDLFTMPATAPFPDAKGNTQVSPSLVGKSWEFPPNRPNDRATILPWKKDWGRPGWKYKSGRRVPV
jgi:hypothetical protein